MSGGVPKAFPRPGHSTGKAQMGMDLRDYFAGQALVGAMVGSFSSGFLSEEQAAALAGEVFRVADAMLAERSKP